MPDLRNGQDPTSRTLEQMWREIAALKELTFSRIQANEDAVKVAHDDLVRVPTAVDKAVTTLRDLMVEKFNLIDEKFNGVEVQFRERDGRVESIAILTSRAVDAALSAQKEQYKQQTDSFVATMTKMEVQFTKLIDQLSVLSAQQIIALNEKIDDVRARLTLIDGRGAGLQLGWGWLVGVIGVVGVLLSAFIVLTRHVP